MGQFFYRNDNFLMLLAAEPTQAHDFLDWLMEIHLANLERFLGAVGDSIDVILFGDDLGMQTGPFISRKMYREFFKPRHATMWNRAKQLANVKVMLHSCGGIRELLPDLIEAGLDAVNPVQTSCRGMDPAGLKAEFGREMVFWGGGCDTQTALSFDTPEAVKKHVRERVRILAPGGGFVFQQVHNIMANVPPENVVAMFEAARKRSGRSDRARVLIIELRLSTDRMSLRAARIQQPQHLRDQSGGISLELCGVGKRRYNQQGKGDPCHGHKSSASASTRTPAAARKPQPLCCDRPAPPGADRPGRRHWRLGGPALPFERRPRPRGARRAAGRKRSPSKRPWARSRSTRM